MPNNVQLPIQSMNLELFFQEQAAILYELEALRKRYYFFYKINQVIIPFSILLVVLGILCFFLGIYFPLFPFYGLIMILTGGGLFSFVNSLGTKAKEALRSYKNETLVPVFLQSIFPVFKLQPDDALSNEQLAEHLQFPWSDRYPLRFSVFENLIGNWKGHEVHFLHFKYGEVAGEEQKRIIYRFDGFNLSIRQLQLSESPEFYLNHPVLKHYYDEIEQRWGSITFFYEENQFHIRIQNEAQPLLELHPAKKVYDERWFEECYLKLQALFMMMDHFIEEAGKGS